MKGQKLTDWFPPEIKPVRVGVYQVGETEGLSDPDGYSYWDGFHWAQVAWIKHFDSNAESLAVSWKDSIDVWAQNCAYWRGISQNSNKD